MFYMTDYLLSVLFSGYKYLGPLREEPSRRYIYEDEIVEIGNKGENSAFIFLDEQNGILPSYYYFDKLSNSFINNDKPKNLKDSLYFWLNLMNIQGFRADPQKEIIYLKLKSINSAKVEVNIADVGFGVSQVLPILLEGLRIPIGETLILEQPEIHLHPNMQMQMSDFFISMAKSGKNFLIETHSEHIINRLIRRVVEDETGELKKLIKIYFIKPSDNGANFEEISIDESRGIVNWPKNFFDQSANELGEIMKAGIKKSKKKRLLSQKENSKT